MELTTETGYAVAALGMGLVGSLHCAGMCGPLALALPGTRQLLLGRLLYNLGRVATYATLGAIIGAIGFSIGGFSGATSPIQRYLSIASGVLLLAMLLFARKIEKAGGGPLARLSFAVRSWFGRLLSGRGGLGVLFLVGVANGLLPCGLVYAALAGALSQGTVVGGATFMALFGLGTVPMMLALSIAGHRIFRFRWARQAIQFTGILVAGLLIVRGLNLGIPYLSPKFHEGLSGMGDRPAVECSPGCKMNDKPASQD